ncbi:uncharacterized protein STEHIDRAFT_168451 [Stereum hirsutum FP-91666 SS1]|uniref:uncharacterized protein n=1 Tax=Stereum hirsutum (strain FP-91666) TaxID=721885 RepID=UPI000440B92D|nr:uncharacterized protein STEHIDRAFT_168451 [Stereum hirsutum FP-91666 SS1]EIM86463.1 hypothetical protein STEHIDRAFT_168451 [Stereum hirsutum FP-91666 SS1]
MIRDFQFIPINYLSDSHSIVRHHHPLSFNCVEYQAPFDTIPPLRSHVHPYLAICNAVSKLARSDMDDLPVHVHEHVALAREIWECWMRAAVPRLAINVGHVRASHQATLEGTDLISFVPESSASASSTRSSSKVLSDDSSVSATSAESCPLLEPHRYCALDRFYPFYAKPRRDPPVPRSAFIHAQSFDYRSEPQTESNASQSRKPLGIPSSGEFHWWPDEQITRSCVSSASEGIWYTRCGKREFIHDDYICTKNDGSVNSYNTNISKPDPYLAFRPDYHELAQAKKLRDAERQRKREQDRLQEVDIVTWTRTWIRAVKPTKPLGPKANSTSRNYSAEPSAQPPHSSHHSWRPDSLPLWPTWTLTYRSEQVAVELSKRPKKMLAPASEDRPAKRRRI